MRARYPWVLLLTLVASVAATAAAQRPLALPRHSDFVATSHYNMHRGGNRGAQGSSHEGRVQLRTTRAGQVTVTDVGEMSEYSSDPSGRLNRTTRTWSHRWTGRIAPVGAGLRIELTVGSSSCRREDRSQDTVISSSECPVATDLVLSCTASSGHWRCVPDAPLPGPSSIAPWILAAGRGCLQRSGGGPFAGLGEPEPCSAP